METGGRARDGRKDELWWGGSMARGRGAAVGEERGRYARAGNVYKIKVVPPLRAPNFKPDVGTEGKGGLLGTHLVHLGTLVHVSVLHDCV